MDAETGFLVGVLSGLVSNFVFGQGPWTPFQMIAFGLLAPVFARKRFERMRLAWLCIFGGLVTFCVYGPIVDAAAMLIFPQVLSKRLVLVTLASGVPFNLVHAVSTVIFLLILARPMLEKLERVKHKYGLL